MPLPFPLANQIYYNIPYPWIKPDITNEGNMISSANIGISFIA